MTATNSKYLTQEYNSTDFNFPYVQALRGEVDSTHCGLVVQKTPETVAGKQ